MIARAFVSLDRGRRAEAEIARRLSTWATGFYHFRRRGLGQAGVEDLVVEPLPRDPALPPWPFPISVKAHAGSLMRMIRRTRPWPAWLELAGSTAWRSERAWLVWKADRRWWLSCGASNPLVELPGFAIIRLSRVGAPAVTGLLDSVCGWSFEDFLARWAAHKSVAIEGAR